MQDNQQSQFTIWIAGGHGFVGHEIAYKLKALDYSVILLSRSESMHTDFIISQTDYSVEDLQTKFNTNDIVINLIGILNEKGFSGKGFTKAHVQTTKALCQAALNKGSKRYLQMSALHASARGPSHYLVSKAQAEKVVEESGLEYTIFRPSVIFGALDSFTNRFAQLIKLSPFVFPLACPRSRFQPIYVGDVAECFVQSISDLQTIGQAYNLCGPDVFTLQEIVELIAKAMGKKRKIIALNQALSKLQATAFQFAPGKPFTMDNYKSLQIDSVCTDRTELPFELSNTRLADAIKNYLS